MKRFYKNYSVVINSFLLLLIIFFHSYLIFGLQSEGERSYAIIELQELHDKAGRVISEDLVAECSTFKDQFIQNKVRLYLEQNGISFDIVKVSLLSIGDLIFEKIIFKSSRKSNSQITYQSTGYLVSNLNSKKCFGLL